ncbi:nuclear transport factor 2 family protein [Aquabacterium sp. A08]|uniref:nuclear transport factor 2 family protein n=1 Tax=Aquabacterium sp. A08 TaxID=2718532 RepID=UPI00142289B6|nr:DUF4440 domain-containing protein [Aquabacterium sp. A08]NIC40970.1 DUF4440 domain-containing protein [Aquabacterium sp. A08]
MKRKLYWLGVPLLAAALAVSWWLGASLSTSASVGGAVSTGEQASIQERNAEFAAGVALLEGRQYPQALAHFQGMVDRYPDLIEAHNNLAHAHAALGDVSAARAALEAGVQAQPSVLALVDNLRQLHARESLLSLNRALQLERRPVAELVLAPVEAIYTAQVPGPKTAADPVVQAPPRAAPGPVARVEAPAKAEAQGAQADVPEPPSAAPAVPVPVGAAAAPATATPTAVAPEAVSHGRVPPDVPSPEQAVLAQVRAWARAWSAPNVPQYLAFYDESFVPPNGLSRRAWEAERQSRIAGRSISVRLENVSVTLQGDRAVVRFRQHYRSGGFVSSVNKRLVWVRRGTQWRIASEGVA